MSDVAAPPSVAPEAIYPPKISLQEIWPWALFFFALLAFVYMVGFQQGVMHEWMHDGRHLLGFPCH